jgi:electron transfer flavoprotein beta subunit
VRRIMVGVKRVVDYNVRVRVKPDNSGVITDGVKMSINPFDEIALEEALRIKERGLADEVVAVSIGVADAQQQLRTALAMGADRAVLVQADGALSPLSIARIFRKLVDRESPQLVLVGKQAIDEDNGQTAQMLAALWDRPQVVAASKLELADGKATVTREVDTGLETLEVDLPAVVSVDLRLNEPRYVKLPDIMKAKKKPLDTLSLADVGITDGGAFKPVKVEPPPQRQKGIMVKDVGELIAAMTWCGAPAADLVSAVTSRPLSEGQVRELVADGLMTIGAHTHSHSRLSRFDSGAKIEDVRRSREECARLTGATPKCFAYPNGDLDEESVRIVGSLGFEVACTSHQDLVWRSTDPLRTPRISVADWSADEFERRIFGYWLK